MSSKNSNLAFSVRRYDAAPVVGDKSRRPFPETLKSLLESHEMSLRELSRRTRKQADWGRTSTMSLLLNEELRPTMEAMEHIAFAIEVRPETFAEYRLGAARRRLDPEVVGLNEALRNLGEK